MNILCKFLSWLFKKETPMPVDFSGLSAKLDTIASLVRSVAAEVDTGAAEQVAQLQADLAAEKEAHAADKAALDQAKADLAAAQSAEADMEAKAQGPIDVLTALLPPMAA